MVGERVRAFAQHGWMTAQESTVTYPLLKVGVSTKAGQPGKGETNGY